mgnify:CR=1 FL=1
MCCLWLGLSHSGTPQDLLAALQVVTEKELQDRLEEQVHGAVEVLRKLGIYVCDFVPHFQALLFHNFFFSVWLYVGINAVMQVRMYNVRTFMLDFLDLYFFPFC